MTQDHDEFLGLLYDLAEEKLSPEQASQLEQLLLDSEESRRRYVDFMLMIGSLYRTRGEGAGEGVGVGDSAHDFALPLFTSTVTPTLTSAHAPISEYIKSRTPWTEYLVGGVISVVIMAAMGLGLWMWKISDTASIAMHRAGASVKKDNDAALSDKVDAVGNSRHCSPAVRRPICVGRITAQEDCRWKLGNSGQWTLGGVKPQAASTETSRPSANSQSPIPNPSVALGDKLVLASGLLEITYNTGAKVLLEGPCTFNVETNGGFLAVGRLTGVLEKPVRSQASGERKLPVGEIKMSHQQGANAPRSPSQSLPTAFVIATPTALITDLGTEFGVEVDRDRATMINVIRGEVEATRDAQKGVPIRQRLKAGEAIYIASLHDLPVPIDLSEHRPALSSQKRTGGHGMRIVLSPELKTSLRQVCDARNSQTVIKPIGLVATAYHNIYDARGKLIAKDNRNLAFRVVTDEIFGRGEHGEGPRSSFDTKLVVTDQGAGTKDQESGNRLATASTPGEKVSGKQWSADIAEPQTAGSAKPQAATSKSLNLQIPKSPLPTTHYPLSTNLPTAFVGLRYAKPVRFDRIKVFLARQEKEGGNWAETPKVYILKNPVDTNTTPPESDKANWREAPYKPLYGTFCSPTATPGPGAVFEFVLTSLPAKDRTGYGWAIGGVRGNGTAGYVAVTELRAYCFVPTDDQKNDDEDEK